MVNLDLKVERLHCINFLIKFVKRPVKSDVYRVKLSEVLCKMPLSKSDVYCETWRVSPLVPLLTLRNFFVMLLYNSCYKYKYTFLSTTKNKGEKRKREITLLCNYFKKVKCFFFV